MSPRGKLITLEGVDGAGKSTHVQFIADTIGAGSRHVVVTREPGGTDFAEQLRKVVLTQTLPPVVVTLIVFAGRGDHVSKVIEPALAAGSSVVCDRFTDATIAYQGAGQGVARELIDELAREVHPSLVPDRTLIFDVPYEVASQRLAASGKKLDRFEREERAFFDRVRNAYLAIAKAEPKRVRLIDASSDPAVIRQAISRELAGL
ncbi:MAG TPA: dTMP kinase [Burkholderiales bacterium]|nr:dTMP kinase [Burkholderiales bacterium]